VNPDDLDDIPVEKLKFIETEEFLVKEDENINEQEAPEESQVIKKKSHKTLIVISVTILVSIFLIWFGLFWQDSYNLLAICNALWLAFVIEFLFGWIIFIYNKNVLSPLIHGAKSFALMFLGKKPKLTYYDYMKKIQDNPIPKNLLYIPLVSSLVILIPAVITMLILW
jgi:uncharacterized membrane protein